MSTDTPAPAPYVPAEEPAPKKKSIGVKILSYIVGAIVVAGLVYGFNYFSSDAAQAKAGECASVTGTTAKPDFKVVDCGAAEANYTIGKVLGSTSEKCGGAYDEYTETARKGPDSKLCLVPNLVEGACYEDPTTSKAMGMAKTECKAGAIKVVKKADGVVDEKLCTDSAPLSYTEPKLTLCLTQVEAS
ncbi:LppU/SCO3897 family protein [Actinokineospora xionganensis]|uniref:Uncharacterized protein n=1 Tax=Actinokineospora xionganensis TaxID=2684470 RepID=A0ABR7L2N9_9PSEU|nr:hypothetical protein [Actinokineospora xionganensis]MBC6446940.1 hypothetical protein [Actinokineospora xionganensis]